VALGPHVKPVHPTHALHPWIAISTAFQTNVILIRDSAKIAMATRSPMIVTQIVMGTGRLMSVRMIATAMAFPMDARQLVIAI
tara:strand:- start:207 stop:455 length:249 start_codon:yes stop_codon:yes gene_type:complete